MSVRGLWERSALGRWRQCVLESFSLCEFAGPSTVDRSLAVGRTDDLCKPVAGEAWSSGSQLGKHVAALCLELA